MMHQELVGGRTKVEEKQFVRVLRAVVSAHDEEIGPDQRRRVCEAAI